MSSIQNHIRVTGGQNRNDINKTLELIQDLFAAPSEDEAYHEKVALSTPKYRHTTSIEFGGPEWTINETPTYETFQFVKKIPTAVSSYPLTQTQNGAGALTFPSQDTKFGCRCDSDGVNYINIPNHSRLNPTDMISISGWTYLPATVAGVGETNHIIIQNGNDSTSSYSIILTDPDSAVNQLEFSCRVNSINYTKTYTYTPNTWIHYCMTWKGSTENRLRLYINKVQQGSDITTSGSLDIDTNDMGIFANRVGSRPLAINSRNALMTIIHNEVTQTWINNHYDGIIDTSDGNNEILTIPFAGSESPMPDASSQSCRSSV